MCGSSWQPGMDNDQGDLGDIVRAGGSTSVPAGAGLREVFDAGWLQLPAELAGFPPTGGGSIIDDFGDPFCSFKDPLLHELAGAMLFDSSKPALSGLIEMITPAGNDGGGGSAAMAGSTGGSPVSAVTGDEVNRPSCGIFSKAAAASMIVSPRAIRPACTVFSAGDMAVNVNTGSAAGAPDEGGLHMPSTRIPGIKRRKGQAKKVVSIPAPEAASSKPGGEAVPPDLWAWRKYGQKPIKGSPYPRSYYRCSSSKGCPARKQVERSRTDPNNLVITYTSEHNHPWPTQRNALAGTTRTSQPAKNSSSAPKSSSHDQTLPTIAKDESKEEAAAKPTTDTGTSPDVKEVILGPETKKKPAATNRGHEVPVHSFHQISYEPAEPSVDDLFAGLGELENNPMRLVFPRRLFMGAKAGGGREDKGAVQDPFSMFDWGESLLGKSRKEGL